MFTHIVIGGGISGLYIGKQLLQKKESFCILESCSDENRGRLISTKYKTNTIELGASIFHSRQKNLLSLIDELGLTHKIYRIHSNSSKTLYIPSKNKSNRLIDKLKSLVTQHHHYMSVEDAILLLFNEAEQHLFKYTQPDWFEIKCRNVYRYIQSIDQEGEIHIMKDGIQQIIHKLDQLLKQHIYFHSKVVRIDYKNDHYDVYTKHNMYQCKNIYVCLPLLNALQINYLNVDSYKQYLNTCIPQSSIRLYVYFNEKQSWLEHVNYIVGEFLGHWMIKINSRLVMLAYTDYDRADFIRSLGPKKTIDIIVKELSNHRIYIEKSDIKKVWFAYWKEAICTLKPNISTKLLHVLKSKLPPNLFDTVVPLDDAIEECWIESHLLTLN
jgi:monoamine oxidase